MTPSPFVLEQVRHAPEGTALDHACGAGRHALVLARTGRRVHALDRDAGRLTALARSAGDEHLAVRVACVDLERFPLPAGRYAVVVNTLYLDRARVPTLLGALAPGGLLVFETFTVAQAALGHPRNPAFLLQPGELRRLVGGLEVLAYREGAVERDGTVVHLASVAARRPAHG